MTGWASWSPGDPPRRIRSVSAIPRAGPARAGLLINPFGGGDRGQVAARQSLPFCRLATPAILGSRGCESELVMPCWVHYPAIGDVPATYVEHMHSRARRGLHSIGGSVAPDLGDPDPLTPLRHAERLTHAQIRRAR
jgi:hypothetical protein